MIGRAGTPMWIRILRIAFGVLGIVALLWIPLRAWGSPGFSLGNYVSYFTIESNIAGVLVLLIGGLLDPAARRWQVVRGAVTLYLLITGVIYTVLLANIDVMLTDKWINDTLHRVLPIVLVADWILVSARLRVSAALIGGWLIYPIAFCAYSLVRGEIVDWYPYPFLDPRVQGYVSLLIGVVMLAAVIALLAIAVAWVGSLHNRREAPVPV
ncbi:Pr6Pr family membrane protein [Nocardia elegans]|uniref:Pr6Pr family membrane protein n=1 Tax=Nocardia elegans TaxID=300029 RepID=UPI0018951752|nr:Pr6Pr family membrane protein [Nocardia elegans]MBF6244699.1 Pr6Pr family membrane protein [Nocardia elegans]